MAEFFVLLSCVIGLGMVALTIDVILQAWNTRKRWIELTRCSNCGHTEDSCERLKKVYDEGCCEFCDHGVRKKEHDSGLDNCDTNSP